MPSFANLPVARASLIRELLRHKRTRDAERAFVLEGPKPIRELLDRGNRALLAIVVTPTCLEHSEPALRRALSRCRAPVYACRDRVFETLSDVRTAQGILAVVRQPAWDQDAVLKRSQLFGLYGEGLQDPANVGTIIRTALAFGADALWLSPDSADVFSPKVVRATTGAVLSLPVFRTEARTVADLFAHHGCTVLAAEAPGPRSRPIQDITSLPSRAILAFGNESRGLSEATLRQATVRFHIPVSPAVNSLNVAASAAIAAFYFSGLPRGA